MTKLQVTGIACGLLAIVAAATAQTPLGTVFTYQGQLKDGGSPANGTYDLRFALFNQLAGGTQQGPTVCTDNTVVSDGLFTVSLDFGAQFAGQERFLEIEVRADTGLGCTNGAGFVALLPRQALRPTPYALYALSAPAVTNADTVDFLHASAAPTAGMLLALDGSAKFPNTVLYAGAGGGLDADLLDGQHGAYYQNASNVNSGTLADARLSSNVALLNTAQTFTGAKTFSAAPAFTAAGPAFSVASTSLVTNLNADLLDGLNSAAFLQAVPNPLTLSGTSATHIIRGENAFSGAGAAGISGVSTAGIGSTYGVYGQNDSAVGRGVFGLATHPTGSNYGVYGQSNSSQGFGGYFTGGAYGLYVRNTGTDGGILVETDSVSAVYASSASSFGSTVEARNSAASGSGVYGQASGASGIAYGGYFESASASGRGVAGRASAGSGTTYGGSFTTNSPDGYGVYAEHIASTGVRPAIYGQTNSTVADAIAIHGIVATTSPGSFSAAVRGQNNGTGGLGIGVWGSQAGSGWGGYFTAASGRGVYGLATGVSGDNRGVFGQSDSTSGRGVSGWASAATGGTWGGHFESASTSGTGVYGLATAGTGTTYGVFGQSNSSGASAYGVWAQGRLGASGTKSFRIDHPDDPENKYLLHYASEAPQPQNFYNGVVTLDERGEAQVTLPDYFAAINREPRYMLTAIGAPMPTLHLAEEISADALAAGEQAGPGVAPPICSFHIGGGKPGAKVSWEVKALRNDRWVRQRGAPVEVEKQGRERGLYQHPELYGQPPEKGMDYHEDRGASAEAAPRSAQEDEP